LKKNRGIPSPEPLGKGVPPLTRNLIKIQTELAY
jgi:hypothetical protein